MSQAVSHPPRQPSSAPRPQAELGVARGMLFYLLLMAGLATLSPFDFALARVHGLSVFWMREDVALNVLLFLPIGFVLPLASRHRAFSLVSILLLGAGFSLLLELSQMFLPSRHPNLVDVLANACGALLGAWLERRIARWLARFVADELVLELPITGSLYLLFAQAVVFSFGVVRPGDMWRALPLAGFAAVPLSALYRRRVQRAQGVGAKLFALYVALGTLVASLVAMLRQPVRVLLFAALVGLITLALSEWPVARAAPQRRFEAATMARALPWLAVYLLLLGLSEPSPSALANHLTLRLLELFAAHTLLGYVLSEIGSRVPRSQALLVGLVTLLGLLVASAFELGEGHLGTPLARALRVLVLSFAAGAGALLHRGQVDLVRGYRLRA